MKYLLSPYNYDLTDPGSIPNLFLQHLYLVVIAMLISIVIAIPLGIIVARNKRIYLPVITVAGLLYTIPGLALIGVLISIMPLSPAIIIIPLVLYAQLVLIRNTAAGINSIDPLLLEVGKAMGMSSWQVLWRITLPLALPIIIAGVRVATVTTIGIASLAALAGQGGLGALVFQNITTGNMQGVIAGGILMGLFAIVADLILLGIQTLLNRGRGTVSLA
ncbi:MAG TPA: ABC transporter permease [Dictyobacter sp.]|jgi:osmoprotectant transport system permease protein|nr:ABC transporter permease [Dictyobacter sp.]